MPSFAESLKRRARRGVIGEYLRVADRSMVRELGVVAAVSVLISMVEVVAIAMMVPLIQLLSGGDLADAGITGEFVERFVDGRTRRDQTLLVLAVVVGLLVVKVAAAAAVRWWTISLVASGSTKAITNLFAAYLSAPLDFHSHRNSATASRTAAVSLRTVYEAGLLGLATLFVELCTVVCIGLLLLVASPVAAIVAIVYFGCAMALFTRVVQRRTGELSRERDERFGRALALLQQGLGGLREIRLRGDESARVEEFRATNADRQRLERKLIFSGEYGRYYIEGTFFLGFGLIATAQILTQGDAAFAGLGMMLAAGFRLLPSAGRFLYGVSSARQGRGSLSIITEELDAMGVERLDGLADRLPASAGQVGEPGPISVELREVGYRYPGSDRNAVDGLSVEVAPGRSLGIVGSSGSGKSTTVDLLCGLLPPSSGEVRIDGRPVGPGHAMSRVAYVPQDVFLIEGTVAENIAFSAGPIDRGRLDRAVGSAQLDRWINTLPDGLDTAVGERGALVSGGQRQRIGIARALYREPSLLILDEATSALDVETEADLTNAIAELATSTTMVVVAHRLSTVRACDHVLVLDEGVVIGHGTYDELSRDHERFARWVKLASTDQ